jgi:DNA-directed RNA polymerase I, II, and III subunit RPABC2
MDRDDDYDAGGGYGGDVEMADDMYNDGGQRDEEMEQHEGEGLENAEDRTELLTEQPSVPIEKSKRITTRYMTKYERARVLGTRALQIR